MREIGVIRSLMAITMLSVFHYINVSAQQVTIEPPPNYILLNESGQLSYRNEASGSIIQLVQINDKDFDSFIADFSKEQLAKNGLTSISCDTVYSNQKKVAVWYKGWIDIFATDNLGTVTRYTRIVWFTGDSKTTIMAVATFPSLGDGVLIEPIIASFSTIKW